MCRTQFESLPVPRTLLPLPTFLPQQYHELPTFDFITHRHDREMLKAAYRVITNHDKWEYLYRYELNETTGFVSSREPDMVALMHLIDEGQGHSGASMAYVMQRMLFIARYGMTKFTNKIVLG